MSPEKLMTLKQVAAHFGKSEQATRRMALPFTRIGRQKRYHPFMVKTWGASDDEKQAILDGARRSPPSPPAPPLYVYAILSVVVNRIKIGISGDPKQRLQCLSMECADELRLLGTMPGSMAIEKELHIRFAAYRHHNEWFEAHPDILTWVSECLKS